MYENGIKKVKIESIETTTIQNANILVWLLNGNSRVVRTATFLSVKRLKCRIFGCFWHHFESYHQKTWYFWWVPNTEHLNTRHWLHWVTDLPFENRTPLKNRTIWQCLNTVGICIQDIQKHSNPDKWCRIFKCFCTILRPFCVYHFNTFFSVSQMVL